MTRRDARLLGFLALLPAVFFLGPLFTGHTHFMGDMMRSFQPWLTYAAQELQAGRLPLWNPYAACGEPFLANPQIMTFFPPAQFFWFFSFAAGWRLFLLFSQTLFATGLYLLFRRNGRAGATLAALAVAWGGFTLIHWEFPSAAGTIPFVPIFLLFAARRAVWGVALATALLFTAGYTQFAYYAVLAGAAFAGAGAIRRKDGAALLRLGAALAAGWILSSPQILAAWEAVRASARGAMAQEEARGHLLSAFFLLKFLIPDIYDKTVSPYAGMAFDPKLWPLQWNWLTTFYAGIAAPALAAAGAWAGRRERDVRAWVLLGLAALALAMGAEPFFTLLRWVPGMKYMTHFSNVMALGLVSLGALAARGLRPGTPRGPALAAAAAGALVSAAAALVPQLRAFFMKGLLGLDALTPVQDAWVAKAAGAAAALCLAALPLLRMKRGGGAALILFLCADLWRFGRDLQPTVPDDFYHRPIPLAQMLAGSPARFSIDPWVVASGDRPLAGDTLESGYQSVRQTLFLNMQVPFRIHQTWGYEVFPNARFTEVRRRLDLSAPLGPLWDFLGARHILTLRSLPPPAVYRAERPNALLYDNPGALSRVTRPGRARTFEDKEELLAWMTAGWAPGDEVLLGEEAAASPLESGGTWAWDDERPGRMSAWGDAGGGWLVWSQVFDGGWEAYVNGERAELRRANHAFQAVALPAGAWRADFLYRPKGLFWAMALAALCAALLAAAGLRRLKRAEGA